MLNKVILISITLVFCQLQLNAQKIDQVTLKNGTTIRGTVIEMVPEGNVTIDDLAGNTWVYAMKDVENISKTTSEFWKPIGEQHQGFVNMTSIGFLAGSQSSEYIAPFSLLTSFGYKTALGLYGGVLAGIEFLNVNHFPVMLDIQYDMRSGGNVTPVAILRGGYALPSRGKDDNYGTVYTYDGGLAGSVGVGLKIQKEPDFAWDIKLLYRHMRIGYTQDNDYQEYSTSYEDVYNRVELRFGFLFGI